MEERIRKGLEAARRLERCMRGETDQHRARDETAACLGRPLPRRFFDGEYLYSLYSEREKYDTEEEWRKFLDKRKQKRQVRTRRTVLTAAACVLLLIGLSYLFPGATGQKEEVYEIFTGETIEPAGVRATLRVDGMEIGLQGENNLITSEGLVVTDTTGIVLFASQRREALPVARKVTLEVGRGEIFSFTLPDSTKVWLNAGSSITFPEFFQMLEREVSFSGEGYFEVAQARDFPFVVRTDDFSVRVTGTHFNISNYENEDVARVSLLSGGVNIEDLHGKMISELTPGKELTGNRTDGTFTVRTFNPLTVTAWYNGSFYFDDMPLADIVRQLERWYNVDFRVDDPVAALRFSGELSRRNNLGELIRILTSTNQLECVQDREGTVRIVPVHSEP